MPEIYKAYYESEIGIIEITGNKDEILSVCYFEGSPSALEIHPCLEKCIKQLDEYFKGQRKEFTIKTGINGTDFQKKVLREVMKIPYGKTASYKEIAEYIGNENAVRAVGNANRNNNLAIIIPCHRIVGSNGHLTGYGGGLWRKQWLLEHEKEANK
ncbi:MAG: methylated-DNA--[protein]-cysteine S-methyltransferase [Clostridia bacterium]|nr:methylated-DNA--[protein]-cysteine S-methyltransferase [Clostridia bacterium]